MPRFAANLTMMFNEHPFLERFGAAAQSGFEAVEFLFPYAFPPEAIAEALERNALRPALFNLPPGDWEKGERGIASLAGRETEFAESLAIAQRYVEATGVGRVHLMAGLGNRLDSAAMRRYRDALLRAADLFGPMGVDVLLEPLNRRDMPGYLLDDYDFAAAFIAGLGRPNVKLQFDIYHCQILHGDIVSRLRKFLPLIGHIQVASIPSRHEPMSEELNDAFLFDELDRLGYAGFIGCEYRPRGETRAGLAWFAPWSKA